MEITTEMMKDIVDYKLDINRFFELFVELDKKYPKRYSLGIFSYKWDVVAETQRIEDDYKLKRNRDMASIVIELMIVEKKLEIFAKDDREIVKE